MNYCCITSLVAGTLGSFALRKLINEEKMRQALLLGSFSPDTHQSSAQTNIGKTRDTYRNKERESWRNYITQKYNTVIITDIYIWH